VKRNSNIELLRIISSCFVVFMHVINDWIGFNNQVLGIDDFFLIILDSGGRVACNIFLVISCWYLCDSVFKTHRIVQTWLKLWVYSVGLSLIGGGIIKLAGWKQFGLPVYIISFFPFLDTAVWYISVYLMLLMVSPYIQLLVSSIGKIKHLILTVILLFIFSGVSLFKFIAYGTKIDSIYCNFAWFCVVYITTSYIKKYYTEAIKQKWGLTLGIIIYVALCSLKSMNVKFAAFFLSDLKSFPNILIAILLFGGFLSFTGRTNKCINIMASSCPAIYIIHQLPVFRNVLANTVLVLQQLYTPNILLGSIVISFVIILSSFIIDYFIVSPILKAIIDLLTNHTMIFNKLNKIEEIVNTSYCKG